MCGCFLPKGGRVLAVKTFVFDLDGVVYRGEQPLPGVADTIQTLRHLGHQVYFFTNNSSKSRPFYRDKLQRMGIETDLDHMMTSGYAAALYLAERGAQGASVYAIGEFGLKGELEAIGMRLVDSDDVDYVVVGIDHKFNYDMLVTAQNAIFRGAKFIAANPDTSFPLEHGRVIAGNGALVAAIKTASGVEPVMIGKPETAAMHEILRLAHATPEDTVVIGDRLDTDILAGNRIGATTVLVLTGISTTKDVETAPPEMQPKIVIGELRELLDAIND